MRAAVDAGAEHLGRRAFQNTRRSGVPTITPFSTTFSVSTAGCATTAPSQSMLPFSVAMVCAMRSGLMSGRAPSCRMTYS